MSMDIFREGALEGKSILVTGGGGGLGLEIGKALAAKARQGSHLREAPGGARDRRRGDLPVRSRPRFASCLRRS